MGVNWKTMQCLSQPLVKKTKQTRDTWVDIKTFYQRDNISQELPSIHCQCRRYMTKTLEESYHCYMEDCLKTSKKHLGFSTFCWLQPAKVYTISQTPDRQCICEVCENFQLLRLAFKYHNINDIEPHTDLCIKQSLCEVCESNADDDGLPQVCPNYGYFQYITWNCKKYGTDVVLTNILKENPGIMESKDKVTLDRWEWGQNKRLKSHRLDKKQRLCPRKSLLNST